VTDYYRDKSSWQNKQHWLNRGSGLARRYGGGHGGEAAYLLAINASHWKF